MQLTVKADRIIAKMRIGVVGSGTMGQVHAAIWRALDVDLVGCCSLHVSQRDALAGQYRMRAFGDFNELLENVDIVDICAPTPLHHPMTLLAAAAGRQIICEKPIALTLADATAMIQAAEQAGVRLFIGLVVRFFSQYRRAKELVERGQLGRLGVIRLKRVSYPPQVPIDNWFLDEERSGGLVVDLMIHDFDYARWLAGDAERVYARRGQPVQGPTQYVQATMRFKNGAIALIEGGWANPPGVFRTSLDIAGSAGLIEWNSEQTPTVRTFFPSGSAEVAKVGLPLGSLDDDPYALELRHAYEAIRSGAPFEVSAQDAMESLRIALAVKQSLNENRVVVF